MSSPLHVVAAVIHHQGRYLATRRSASMSNPLLWEFPGGKIEPGEDPRQALRREILEELGIPIVVGEHLVTTQTPLGERVLHLHAYAATLEDPGREIVLAEHERLGWFLVGELGGLEWSVGDLGVLEVLQGAHD